MYTRRLGESDLFITPVGFGAWAIGGSGWSFAWGAQSDADSVAVIHKALDAGMNWIDTAAVYGLGHSEEIVARALRGGRWPPYIFTKCAMIWNERKEISYRLKADSIRRECEASLRRLQVEVIDLSQEIAPITSLQPPYSLINRKMEQEVLPFAVQEHIGVITYSPMASGLLTGAMTRERIARLPADDWRRTSPNFQEPLLSRNLRLVGLLRSIGDRHGCTPAEVAIAWVLHNPAVTGRSSAPVALARSLVSSVLAHFTSAPRRSTKSRVSSPKRQPELSLFSWTGLVGVRRSSLTGILRTPIPF